MRFDNNRMFANDEPAASRAPRPERLGSFGEAVQLTVVFALMVVSAVALAIGMVERSASVWIGGHVAWLASLLVAGFPTRYRHSTSCHVTRYAGRGSAEGLRSRVSVVARRFTERHLARSFADAIVRGRGRSRRSGGRGSDPDEATTPSIGPPNLCGLLDIGGWALERRPTRSAVIRRTGSVVSDDAACRDTPGRVDHRGSASTRPPASHATAMVCRGSPCTQRSIINGCMPSWSFGLHRTSAPRWLSSTSKPTSPTVAGERSGSCPRRLRWRSTAGHRPIECMRANQV